MKTPNRPSPPQPHRSAGLTAALAGVFLALLTTLAGAADLFVTNTADSGSGSLRQMLVNSENGDTIRFALPTSDPGYNAGTQSWTITVREPWVPNAGAGVSYGRGTSMLVVEKNISISGPGADKVTIRGLSVYGGSRAARQRPLYISPGAVVTISGLTFTKPASDADESSSQVGGGAILNDSATLTLRDCTIRDTFTSDDGGNGVGGAVLNGASEGPATLTVERCLFENNRSLNGAAALANGAIYNGNNPIGLHSATTRVSQSIFRGNSGRIAAIVNARDQEEGNGQDHAPLLLEIEDCVIVDNPTSVLSMNSDAGVDRVTTRVSRTSVTNNRPSVYAAPFFSSGGFLEIKESTISESSGGSAGAIICQRGAVEVTNSTISDNHPTLAFGINPAYSAGAILFQRGVDVSVRNCTITGNSSPSGLTFSFVESGVPASAPGSLHLSNSIIHREPGGRGSNLPSPLPATHSVTSHGYNISDDDFGGFLTALGDQANTLALLGPLQDNGGPTKTHALLPGSPAIDAGDPAFVLQSLPQDQRGFLRIAGGRIDIGAFESGSYLDQPPAAEAGASFSVNEGDLVALDGSASGDPNGGLLTYSWTQVPGGTPVVLTDADAANPTFTAPTVAPGGETLTFNLTVTAVGGSATDAVSVTVVNVNHAPVADAGVDQSIAEGSPVTLDGSASFDIDADGFSYAWTQVSGPNVILTGADMANPSFTAPYFDTGGASGVVATLVFELVVNDGQPENSTGVDRVTIEITNTNNPPVAAAGPDQTVDENTGVMLDGSASSDPDSDALTHSWTQVANGSPAVSLVGANTAMPSFTAPYVNAGGAEFIFQLRVDDGYGGSVTDLVTVRVQNRNDPPLASAARPSEASLWPPNHQMVAIGITGVTDPDNNATITITGVTQDEPTNGQGDGDTPIDAIIQADGTVLIRSERAGGGDGRVYRISFNASDPEGTTSGVVKVSVPKSKNKGASEGSAVVDSTR